MTMKADLLFSHSTFTYKSLYLFRDATIDVGRPGRDSTSTPTRPLQTPASPLHRGRRDRRRGRKEGVFPVVDR